MTTELQTWLESEIEILDNDANLDLEGIGYLEALNNCLDFIQGAEIYLDWKARQAATE